MRPTKILILYGILLFLTSTAAGQTLSELQQKKENALKEIEYNTRLLNEVRDSERASMNRLRLLNNRIRQRNELIVSINNEIDLYQKFINDNVMVTTMLEEDIEELKKEYAALIRAAYLQKNEGNSLLHLLSAENLNQAHRRLLYMKQYTSYRKNQEEVIRALKSVLNNKAAKLAEQNRIKQELIEEIQNETKQLGREKSQQNTVYNKLQKERRYLTQKLKEQNRIEKELERAIARLIEEEARKSREAGGSGFALTPEQKLTGDNFSQNKRRLPWPVERGIITERFGIHQHPVLTNVQVRNNGINIATETGSIVRAIFNGEVSRVFGISGGNSAVIIRHGKYLSVYSNLSEVVVKKGDVVSTKQSIGTVYFDKDEGDRSILKFQIWHENQKLNPEEWIGK